MKTIQYAILLVVFSLLISCGNDDQLDSIEATGTIEAKEITISSKTIGEIKKIRFDEGDKVQQGDTIILIDNESASIQLKQAAANRINFRITAGTSKKRSKKGRYHSG